MGEYIKKPGVVSHTLPNNTHASRQTSLADILQTYKKDLSGNNPVQEKFLSAPQTGQEAIQAERTGLPDELKKGLENLSGYTMDDVQVHYNSSKPAQLNALAYAQGTDIHVAPGQEKHLPHEAWHVVQQKQGRVQPTVQMVGINVNDNAELEREADVMGAKAVQKKTENKLTKLTGSHTFIAQFKKTLNLASGTDPEKFLSPETAEDRVVNLDRGDMLYAQIILESFDQYQEINAIQVSEKNERIKNATDKEMQIKREKVNQYMGEHSIEEIRELIKLTQKDINLEQREQELRDNGLTLMDVNNYDPGEEKFDEIVMVSGYGLPVLKSQLVSKVAGWLNTDGKLILSGNISVLRFNGVSIKIDRQTGNVTFSYENECFSLESSKVDKNKRIDSQHTVGGGFSEDDIFYTLTFKKKNITSDRI